MQTMEYQQKAIPVPKNPQGVSIANLLRAIADDKSLVLFDTISLAGGDSHILISKIGLTRKQYYSRISSLLKTGLIGRKNGHYELTSFGMIVYEAYLMIGRAVDKYWKLKAIDSLEIEHKLPIDERNKIINALIDNEDIIKILVNRC